MSAAEGAWTLAFNRFGLGARPGAAVRSGDPRQALLAELSAEEGARIDRSDLLSTPKVLQAGHDADRLANRQGMDALKPGGDVALLMRKAAEGAARLMAVDDGPRVGALAFDGWDTHANEGAGNGRLAALLGALDGAIAAIETGMGPDGAIPSSPW